MHAPFRIVNQIAVLLVYPVLNYADYLLTLCGKFRRPRLCCNFHHQLSLGGRTSIEFHAVTIAAIHYVVD